MNKSGLTRFASGAFLDDGIYLIENENDVSERYFLTSKRGGDSIHAHIIEKIKPSLPSDCRVWEWEKTNPFN